MSPEQPITISAINVDMLLAGPRAQGAAIEELLRTAGIDASLPLDAAHHVTLQQFAALLTTTIVTLDDEGLGFFSRKLRRGSFALMVQAAIYGDTLAGGLAEYCRTLRLLQDDVVPVLIDDGRHVRVELHFKNAAICARQFVHELLLRSIWRFMSWLEGGHLRAERIELAFSRPTYAEQYQKIFPAELVFDVPHSAIWFLSRPLQGPVRRDAVSLKAYLRTSILDMLVPAVPTRITDRVRAYLQAERVSSSSWPGLQQTARALNMSGSSLQRHLSQEGTSFQLIRVHLLRDWAIYRLQTTTLSIPAVAHELGFADAASFSRAFKRWTGYSPGHARRG